MKRFVRNIVLFALPIVLVVAFLVLPFFYIGKKTGELKKIDELINRQRTDHSVLFGLAYNEQTPFYKLVNTYYYKAPLIALGTSRVMQFSQDFFSTPFYNCGGCVEGNYSEYVNFLKNMTYSPDCIILGLDQWVFNDSWNCACKNYQDYQQIVASDRNTNSLLKSIRSDWYGKKWSFSDSFQYKENIGFNGQVKDMGFRYDGSYYYGEAYRWPEKQPDYMFVDTITRIENGNNRFEWADEVDEDTLIQLQELLQYCDEQGIYVVGFLPPFAPTVYEAMEDSGNYKYINYIYSRCYELFDSYGFEIYDYTNPINLNVSDEYFVDGFHGSDIVYALIVRDMYLRNSSLGSFVDAQNIDELLANAYSTLTFVNPDTWRSQ